MQNISLICYLWLACWSFFILHNHMNKFRLVLFNHLSESYKLLTENHTRNPLFPRSSSILIFLHGSSHQQVININHFLLTRSKSACNGLLPLLNWYLQHKHRLKPEVSSNHRENLQTYLSLSLFQLNISHQLVTVSLYHFATYSTSKITKNSHRCKVVTKAKNLFIFHYMWD